VPKLPVVKTSDLIKYLNGKGFSHIHTKGSHYVMASDTRYTEVPLNKKEIGDGLLLTILAESGIDREEFIRDWYD